MVALANVDACIIINKKKAQDLANLGERPSLTFPFFDSVTVVEFLREVDLTAESETSFPFPVLSTPSDILFLFVAGRGRSLFLISSLFLFFTAPFWGSRSEGLRLAEAAETLSFSFKLSWSFFQLLERRFASIPMQW